MIYAIIKNGLVVNTIIADESFAAAIKNEYDFVIRVDQLDPQPGLTWTYVDGIFTAPIEE